MHSVSNLQTTVFRLAQIDQQLVVQGCQSELIVKTTKQLDNLTLYLREGLIPDRSKRTIINAQHTLQNLARTFAGWDALLPEIQVVRQQVLKIQSEFNSFSFAPKPTLYKPQILLQLAFMCDIDAVDHNGAIVGNVISFMRESVPIITSRPVLCCKNIQEYSCRMSALRRLQDALCEMHSDWDAFQQCDPQFGNELILLLPKSLLPSLTPKQKLARLDFTTSGTLKHIPFSEALQGAEGNVHLEAFFHMFNDKPTVNKIVHISGHGSASCVAALDAKNFSDVQDFLALHLVRVLSLISCFIGGKPKLFNHFAGGQGHPYLTVVHSLGDFPSASGHSSDAALIFKKTAEFLQDPGKALTTSNFASLLVEVERDSNKDKRSAVQVYFPHSGDAPLGFYSCGEQNTGMAITYCAVKRTQIAYQSFMTVSEGKFLKLHPQVIDLSLKFIESNPVLISMLPGNSHHFIQEIQLIHVDNDYEEEPKAYLMRTLSTYSSMKFKHCCKSFFIARMAGSKYVMNDVIVQLALDASFFLWKQGKEHYVCVDNKSIPITPFVYDLLACQVVKACRPLANAIRLASGGQEGLECFDAVVKQKKFISSILFNVFFDLEGLNIKFPEGCLALLSMAETTSQEEEQLLFFLLAIQPDLALPFFQSKGINPNAKSFFGTPLLCFALRKGLKDFAAHLLQMPELDVLASSKKNSALHLAVGSQDLGLVKLLLARGANIKQKNHEGWSPLRCILKNSPIDTTLFDFLMESGADVNEYNNSQMTLLGYYADFIFDEQVLLLLSYGADPNLGSPSALTLTMINNDLSLLELLLENGGKPFVRQADNGTVPFIEALFRGSVAVVKFLMDRPDCNLAVQDNQGITPLLAALYSGNIEKIALLLDRQAPVPLQLYPPGYQLLADVLNRLLLLHDEDAVKGLFSHQGLFASHLEAIVASLLSSKWDEQLPKPICRFLIDCIHKGIIDINRYLPRCATTCFGVFCSCAAISFDAECQELIELCFSKGADCNFKLNDKGRTPWRIALQSKHYTLIECFLWRSSLQSPEQLIKWHEEIVYCNDLTLIQLALSYHPPVLKSAALDWLAEIVIETFLLNSRTQILEWLLDEGLDLSAPCRLDRRLSLFGALIQKGEFKHVQFCTHNTYVLLESRNSALLPPLEIAAQRTDRTGEEIFKHLVLSGENMNAPTQSKYASSFALLVRYGSLAIVRWALSRGGKINVATDKLTPVQAAARDRSDLDKEKFKMLIAKGGDINAGSSSNPPALISIIEQGDQQHIRWCFDHGARCEGPAMQRLAVAAAVASGSLTILQQFLNQDFPLVPEVLAQGKWIVQGYAKGEKEMLAKVLQGSLDFPDLDDSYKEKLWFDIALNGDIDTAKLLWTKKLWTYYSSGLNACLHMAIKLNQRVLLEHVCASFSATDFTAMPSAAFRNILIDDDVEALQFLLHYGLDPHAAMEPGQTLLTLAVEANATKTTSLLLELDVDPHQKVGGLTLIHKAVAHQNIDMVKMLLDKGAAVDIFTKSPTGVNAVDLAFQRNLSSIIDLFRSKCAADQI